MLRLSVGWGALVALLSMVGLGYGQGPAFGPGTGASPSAPEAVPFSPPSPAALASQRPAPPTKLDSPSTRRAVDCQATVKGDAQGRPVLLISGLGPRLATASVQLALVVDPAVDPQTLEPLAIDARQALATWGSQAAALNKPAFEGSRQAVCTRMDQLELGNQKALSVYARNNALGRPASYAVDDDGRRLAFYLLSAWTDQNYAVHVEWSDLQWPSKTNVGPKFDGPGRLVVWVLDENRPPEKKVIDWPGKTAPPPQASAAPAGGLSAGTFAKPELSADPPRTGGSETFRPSSPAAGSSGTPNSTAPAGTAAPSPAAGGWRGTGMPPAIAGSPTASKPAASEAVVVPKRPLTIEEMTVDQLSDHIERNYSKAMAPSVRQSWEQGWYLYYKLQNPDEIRRAQFMATLRTCWHDQPSGELRDAIAVLYLKLKKQQIGGQ